MTMPITQSVSPMLTLRLLIATLSLLVGTTSALAAPMSSITFGDGRYWDGSAFVVGSYPLAADELFLDASVEFLADSSRLTSASPVFNGDYAGGRWGAVDPSGSAFTSQGNIVEGRGGIQPLQFTLTGLAADRQYELSPVYMTHTDPSQNWGGTIGLVPGSAAFTFDNSTVDTILDFQNEDTNNVVRQVRGTPLGSPIMTNATGTAEVFIGRSSGVRTMFDGVIVADLGPAPPPPPMPTSIAQFDLNDGGDLNDNQDGWASLNADLVTDSATQNGITLTVTGNANGNGRDRGTAGAVGLSPVPNVTRDFMFNDDQRGFTTPYFTVTLDGLQANTEYDLRWHHYEQGSGDDQNRLALYQDSAIPANLLFETGPYDLDTTNYFTDFSANSDASGRITLVTGPHSGGRSIQMLNGLEVFSPQVIPEPTTLSLLGLAACGLGMSVRGRCKA